MSNIFVKKGEVISISWGFEKSFQRKGPFLAERDFDLNAFVDVALAEVCANEPWRLSTFRSDIPNILLEQGLISLMPYRKLHLGAFGSIDFREEATDQF